MFWHFAHSICCLFPHPALPNKLAKTYQEEIAKPQEEQSDLPKLKEKLVPVYKKVQIHKTNFSLVFLLKTLLKDDLQYG